MWQERTIPLEWFDQIRWEEENGGEKDRERKEREEEKMRERLLIFFRFSGDWTVGSGRSKRQSGSTHRELRVGTKINGFRQTSRGRGFSPTRFIFGLRAIQMARGFWGRAV